MGRTKGSKNGVRKVPIRKSKLKQEQSEKIQESIENIEPLVEDTNKSDLPVFSPHIIKAFKDREYEKCSKLIQQHLDINSSENKNHYKILLAGSLTMLRRDFGKIHALLDEVIADDPKNPSSFYSRGVAFYFQKMFDESITALDRAIELEPGQMMQKARDMKKRVEHERLKFDDIEDLDATIGGGFIDGEVTLNKENLKELAELMDQMSPGESVMVTPKKSRSPDMMSPGLPRPPLRESDIMSPGLPRVAQLDLSSPEKAGKDQKHIDSSGKSGDPPAALAQDKAKQAKPSTPQEFFDRGMELYQAGSLKKALKMFEKALKLDSDMEKAQVMGSKSQELIELMDLSAVNLQQKNYEAVEAIASEAMEIAEMNDIICRPFFFQRGLAYYHLGKNEESIKDYAEYERINKVMEAPVSEGGASASKSS